MSKKASSKIWAADTELVSIAIELEATEAAVFPANYNYYLHAWFLNQVKSDDPDLSAYLHDGQSEKPFAIAQLEGDFVAKYSHIQLPAGSTYRLAIASLCKPLCEWLSKWFKKPPQVLNINAGSLKIESIAIAQPATTYSQLFAADLPSHRNFDLSFITPTGFRQKGHHLPLPVPRNIFHSYLRRWNDFAPEAFDQDAFLNWIDEIVFISDLEIVTVHANVAKSGTVTGFTGFVEFAVDRKVQNNPEFERLLYALVRLAPYCGTGHKTTFGLGQTRLGKVEARKIEPMLLNAIAAPDVKPSTSTERFLTERTAELTEIFLAIRKRQGGDRAKLAASVWATVLARRETGESLQAIAADLKMPYETAKTYSKLARRALKGI
jgi:CRISPR-associated endoribonuclease Cas6